MNNENSLALLSLDNQRLPAQADALTNDPEAFHLKDLDESEKALCEEVRFLMMEDATCSRARRASQAEQRQIRLALGEKLYRLKESICRPGRKGGWSAFLQAAAFPKRTADRYVELYRREMNPLTNLASGQITPSPEELAEELERTSRRLRKWLGSEAEVKWFVQSLALNLLAEVQLRTACNDV